MLGVLLTTIASAVVTTATVVSKCYRSNHGVIDEDSKNIDDSKKIDDVKTIEEYKIGIKCYDLLGEVYDHVKNNNMIEALAKLDTVEDLNKGRDHDIKKDVDIWRKLINRHDKINSPYI